MAQHNGTNTHSHKNTTNVFITVWRSWENLIAAAIALISSVAALQRQYHKHTKFLSAKYFHAGAFPNERPHILSLIWRELKRRKLLAYCLLVLLILVPIAALTLMYQSSVDAAWFNDNWSYRQTVTVTNTGSAQTDYQISIGVGTSALIVAGKMQSDCDDIRVTDLNGRILSHWVQKAPTTAACNGTGDTKVWVNVPSIPTSGQTLYVYYGNPSAVSVEEGKKTFPLFFEDFRDKTTGTDITALTGWSKDVDQSSTYTIDTNRLKMVHPGAAPSEARDHATYTFGSEYTSDFAMDADVTVANSDSWDFVMAAGDTGFVSITSAHTTSMMWSAINNEVWHAHDGVSTWVSLQTGMTVSTTHQLSAAFNISGDSVRYSVDDVFKNSVKFPDTASTGLKVMSFGNYGHSTLDSTWYVDNIRVRKYSTTEPSVGSPSNEEKATTPVVHFKFDEGSGTAAQDSTANNYDGAHTGSVSHKTEDMCISGKCLLFSGGRVTVANTNNRIIPASNAAWSMSFWLKTNTLTAGNVYGLSTNETYLTSGYRLMLSTAGDGFSCGTAGNHKIRFSAGQSGGTGTICASTSVKENTWYHVAISYDGSSATMYLNGANVGSSGSWSIISNTNTINFGGGIGGVTNIPGYMDEVKVFNYARSSDQAKLEYAARGSVEGVSTGLGSNKDNASSLSNGLVGYWMMNEGTGTTALDSSGVGNTATLGTGSSAPTWTTGKFDDGLSFDGTDDYVSMSGPVGTGSFSIAQWVKPTSGNYLFWQQETQIWINGSTFSGRLYNGTTSFVTATSTSVATGSWQHVVLVYDGTQIYFYLNGVRDGSATAASGSAVAGTAFIGRDESSGWLNGVVDETRVYNRALSPLEARQLYDFAPGPVLHYSFDEKSGTTVMDRSGIGNTAGLGGSPTWVNGKFGGGMNAANTTSDYVNAPNVDIGSEWTATNWFYYPLTTTVGATWNTLFRGNANDHQVMIQRSTNLLGMYDNAGGTGFQSSGFNMSTLSTGWHHLATVGIGGSQRFYVDGIYRGTAPRQSTTDIRSIGNYWGGNQNFGTFDEVKIYQYARTNKQILEDMNAGHPLAGSPVGSQAIYYKFDEGFGTTINNSIPSGTAYVGTMYNIISWKNEGKVGKSLNIGGTTAHVVISNSANLRYNDNDMSISAWIKPDPTDNAGYIYSKPWNGGGEYNYYLSSPGGANPVLTFTLLNGAGSSQALSAAHTIKAGEWNHITITVDGATNRINMYINGFLSNTVVHAISSWTPTSGDASTPLVIGCVYPYGSNSCAGTSAAQYQGEIDEFKFYTGVLSQEEVLIDMNAGSTLGISVGSVRDNSDNPVAHYKFNEGIGATAANDGSCGSGCNGNWAGTTSSIWTSTGKIGGAGNFNGSDNQLNLTTDSNLRPSTAVSVSFWVYPESLDISTWFHFIGFDSWNTEYSLIKNNDASNTLYWTVNTGTATSVTFPNPFPTLNRWYHVAATYGDGFLRLYVDGVAATPVAKTGAIVYTDTQPHISKFASTYFDGKIDDFKIYNYVRSANQIKADASTNNINPSIGGAPIADWSLNEKVGSTAYDRSGNNRHLYFTNSPTWSTGKVGASLDLDADDVATNDWTDFTLNNQTIEFWMNAESLASAWGDLVGTHNNTDINRFHLHTDNTIIWYAPVGFGAGSSLDTNFTPTVGRWHHVAGTYDGATLRVYVDGIQRNSSSVGATNYTATGGYIGGATEDYNGKLDEVRIYDYARTPAQIAEDFNGGGPVLQLKLDEGQGPTAYSTAFSDSLGTGGTANITIGPSGTQTTVGIGSSAGTAWGNGATGKRNSSIYLDGTDDFISIGVTNAFRPQFGSVALWVKLASSQLEPNYFIFSHPEGTNNSRIYITTNASGTNLSGTLGNGTTIGSVTVAANTWHHVVLTWNGTTGKFYVNGIDQTTTSTFNGLTTILSTAYLGSISTGGESTVGQFDDFRIYSYPLSLEQVKTLYNDASSVRWGPATGSP